MAAFRQKLNQYAPWAMLALVGALLGGAGAGAFTYFFLRSAPPVEAAGPAPCETDPALIATLEAMQTKAESTEEELNGIRVQMADIATRLDAPPGGIGGDEQLRLALPPPYVQKVDAFFQTAAARNLLSAKAMQDPAVRFGEVRFVSDDTITVPYSLKGREYFLLARIRILDYYDLQFDALWDSYEDAK